mgnify:CR=1 FL=1
MKKKSLFLFFPFFFLVVIVVAYFYLCTLVTPVSNSLDEQSVKFEIQYGASTKSIINDLKKENIVSVCKNNKNNPKGCIFAHIFRTMTCSTISMNKITGFISYINLM